MKSKWLLALTCLVIGMASLIGKTAYADTNFVGMSEEPGYCADWSFHDSTCSSNSNLMIPSGGKAAFGESTEQTMPLEALPKACEDWNFGTQDCQAYLSTVGGKAAYGESTMPNFEPAAYCADWSYNDKYCALDIRE